MESRALPTRIHVRFKTLIVLSSFFLGVQVSSLESIAESKEKANAPFCEEPQWNTPAESHEGIFHGDLEMRCTATLNHHPTPLKKLKAAIEAKINQESLIHEGPLPIQIYQLAGQKWDVSHRIQEDGSAITIREEAELATDEKTLLIYQTHSKQVSAQGMASYLTAVNFSVQIRTLTDQQLTLIFKNQVTVKRPWFALDLLFAPIARSTCLKKMGQIREKLFPWILSFL